MRNLVVAGFSCLALFAFCACGDTEITITPEEQEESFKVCFSFSLETEVKPFLYSRSIPEGTPGDPESVGDTSPYTVIDYFVFKEGTAEPLKHVRYKESDESNDDFGVFLYDELEEGTYRFCFLAHSDESAEVGGSSVTFADLEDAFYSEKSLKVDVATNESTVDIVLKRSVARIEFIATDVIPSVAKDFTATVTGLYQTFDLKAGQPSATTVERSVQHTFTAEEYGTGVGNKYQFYTFVPQDVTTIASAHLVTAGNSVALLREYNLTDLPVFINRATCYRGKLYTPQTFDETFALEIEAGGSWDTDYEVTLPE